MNFSSKLVLASNSPRRQELLAKLGLNFTIRVKEVDESFPANLHRHEIAEYLASKKAEAYREDLAEKEILLTADTIVCLEDQVLNKPADFAEARTMLQSLSGKAHEVITGVCLLAQQHKIILHDVTWVYFKSLSEEEINWYLETYQPFDKAGAYGAQDWIGMVAIHRLEGSFYNVMGLPVHKVYEALQTLESQIHPDSTNY
ncbi:Maf family nucleotide pyrophosphatase [Adhaeribacter radiodurans]|uniref:dTTP/UTP pyrophosphatase n=1 Tax=Adhaeribacter radiodurans TaxID=2745197 RepID=A0A7L7L793_9BACT|nr:Maf family nucleotide pyrophosphatase [Adhaeribacter radiodurans]QMU28678.1 septum formation protein Maf [Adhaeribacter radiodurans]